MGWHAVNPVPFVVGPTLTFHALVEGDGIGIYDDSIAVGVVPDHQYPHAWGLSRVWFILGTAESGATGEAYTQFSFRVGSNFASYTEVRLMKTTANPAAGAPITEAMPMRILEAGDGLFVYPSRVGAGSVNLDLSRVTFGFDLVAGRVG